MPINRRRLYRTVSLPGRPNTGIRPPVRTQPQDHTCGSARLLILGRPTESRQQGKPFTARDAAGF